MSARQPRWLQVCKLCSQVGLENDQHTHCTGDGISDQFEPFAADGVFEIGKPGDVGARPCEVRDDTEFDRIGNLHEHDWQRVSLLMQRLHRRCGDSNEHVGCHFHQLGRVDLLAVFSPTIVD